VCEALNDLVPDGGRIVNVCSSAGKLSIIKDAALRDRWEHATSRAQLDELTHEFIEGVRSDTYAQKGWPRSMYGVSKLAECQYSRILADELRPRRIAVAAVCPGWCNTAMASFRGPRPASEGADTPVWLAFQPDSEWEWITGRFWKDRKEEPW
jgi:NAD(P)-dependent dehydrogenase (short-subunit alcohol dehydrogenase family)